MTNTPRLLAMGGFLLAFAMTACSGDTTVEDAGQPAEDAASDSTTDDTPDAGPDEQDVASDAPETTGDSADTSDASEEAAADEDEGTDAADAGDSGDLGLFDPDLSEVDNTSAEIGPDGGTISSPDGRLTLTFPEDALDELTTITIAETNPNPPGDTLETIGARYVLMPDGLEFAESVTSHFEVPLSEAEALRPEDDVYMAAITVIESSDGSVEPLSEGETFIDLGAETVTISGLLDHFSAYTTYTDTRGLQARLLIPTADELPIDERQTFGISMCVALPEDAEYEIDVTEISFKRYGGPPAINIYENGADSVSWATDIPRCSNVVAPPRVPEFECVDLGRDGFQVKILADADIPSLDLVTPRVLLSVGSPEYRCVATPCADSRPTAFIDAPGLNEGANPAVAQTRDIDWYQDELCAGGTATIKVSAAPIADLDVTLSYGGTEVPLTEVTAGRLVTWTGTFTEPRDFGSKYLLSVLTNTGTEPRPVCHAYEIQYTLDCPEHCEEPDLVIGCTNPTAVPITGSTHTLRDQLDFHTDIDAFTPGFCENADIEITANPTGIPYEVRLLRNCEDEIDVLEPTATVEDGYLLTDNREPLILEFSTEVKFECVNYDVDLEQFCPEGCDGGNLESSQADPAWLAQVFGTAGASAAIGGRTQNWVAVPGCSGDSVDVDLGDIADLTVGDATDGGLHRGFPPSTIPFDVEEDGVTVLQIDNAALECNPATIKVRVTRDGSALETDAFDLEAGGSFPLVLPEGLPVTGSVTHPAVDGCTNGAIDVHITPGESFEGTIRATSGSNEIDVRGGVHTGTPLSATGGTLRVDGGTEIVGLAVVPDSPGGAGGCIDLDVEADYVCTDHGDEECENRTSANENDLIDCADPDCIDHADGCACLSQDPGEIPPDAFALAGGEVSLVSARGDSGQFVSCDGSARFSVDVDDLLEARLRTEDSVGTVTETPISDSLITLDATETEGVITFTIVGNGASCDAADVQVFGPSSELVDGAAADQLFNPYFPSHFERAGATREECDLLVQLEGNDLSALEFEVVVSYPSGEVLTPDPSTDSFEEPAGIEPIRFSNVTSGEDLDLELRYIGDYPEGGEMACAAYDISAEFVDCGPLADPCANDAGEPPLGYADMFIGAFGNLNNIICIQDTCGNDLDPIGGIRELKRGDSTRSPSRITPRTPAVSF